MADNIVKNQTQTITFGDFDNTGKMTPIAFKCLKVTYNSIYAVITWGYNDGTGSTIDLCRDNIETIDFESFGTTLEAELAKIALTPNDIQVVRDKTYVIKDADGTIKPFSNFEVTYDQLNPRTGIVMDRKKYHVGPFRDEQQAIDYVKKYGDHFLYTSSNYKVKKVPIDRTLRNL